MRSLDGLIVKFELFYKTTLEITNTKINLPSGSEYWINV